MLCEKCVVIFTNCAPVNPTSPPKVFTALNSGFHHEKAEDIKLWSDRGCHICACLYRALPQQFVDDISLLNNPRGSCTAFELFCSARDGVKLTLSFTFSAALIKQPDKFVSAARKKLDQGHRFYLYPVSGMFDDRIRYTILDITTGTGTKGALTYATKWLNNCSKYHSSCRTNDSDRKFYPTRLIDVGTSPAPLLRLCIRGEDPMGGAYATLSYCRGSTSLHALSISNIDEMRMSIPQEELPRMFREAIRVTQTLGIRYLWIESLCILQDVAHDKQREASLRGEVFSNSHCTIAATHAKDPSEGLFTVRNPFHYQRFSFMENLRAKNNLDHMYYNCDSGYVSSRIEDAPLCQDAFFVQDRILSPRILHFTRDLLFWECRMSTSCEEFPSTIPFDQANKRKPAVTKSLRINSTAMNPKHPESHRHFWGCVVRKSTQNTRKRDEDKLNLVAGVAKEVQEIIKSPYLAGLWQCSLATDLLWQTEKCDTGRESMNYRAPSWSWASVDGPVFPGSWITGEELITLIDYQTTPATNNPLGQVLNGQLRLSGRLYPAKVEFYAGSTEVKFDGCFEPSRNKIVPDRQPIVPEGQEKVESTLYILPVVHCGQGQLPSRVGIALAPAEGKPQGYYRRFGSYRAAYPDQAERVLGVCPTELSLHDWWYEEGKSQDHILCIV